MDNNFFYETRPLKIKCIQVMGQYDLLRARQVTELMQHKVNALMAHIIERYVRFESLPPIARGNNIIRAIHNITEPLYNRDKSSWSLAQNILRMHDLPMKLQNLFTIEIHLRGVWLKPYCACTIYQITKPFYNRDKSSWSMTLRLL